MRARVAAELKAWSKLPPAQQTGITFVQTPDDWDGKELTAILDGPEGTPYWGGVFFVKIQIPAEYPRESPTFQWQTRVYHEAWDVRGRECWDFTDSRKAWRSTFTLAGVLRVWRWILIHHVDAEFDLVPEIGRLYRQDRKQFETMASDWTRKYAQ